MARLAFGALCVGLLAAGARASLPCKASVNDSAAVYGYGCVFAWFGNFKTDAQCR